MLTPTVLTGPDFNLFSAQMCSEESPGLCGEEEPRRQAFVTSSNHMSFLEVCPEREVFLLEKSFILDTVL